ncbi:VapC toxin family PIN domain ribonuclease [Halobacteriales archaeon SW_10_68_16]|jgi:predicted nucleic acid-binding protein|nr:MAG: VapC toxin family PIN domain ribonuclease [Halobacteriales archaeon SW_10_68_16]
MARALIDTTVLFAAAYRRDGNHADALPILQGIDDGSLPDTVVLDYILGETLNGLTTHAGHEAAVDFLDRIEGNTRFHVESLDANTFAAGKSLFRERRRLSFVDACLVVYAQAEEIRYLYALDDDFDGFDDVSRLETTTNPYDPR